jgi:hypothetical protein
MQFFPNYRITLTWHLAWNQRELEQILQLQLTTRSVMSSHRATWTLVRGCGHGCVSRNKFLDVPGRLRSKLTVWKEEQFTVLPFQGIDQRKKRVLEWVTKATPRS